MKILIVDGYDILTELISEYLTNHQCFRCSTIESALDVCEKEHPDLIITSMRVPHSNSIMILGESFQVFRSFNKDTPIIIATGLDSESLAKNLVSQDLKNMAIINKPFSKESLLTAVGRFK